MPVAKSFALHLREGGIWSEERGRWRLSDAGQLVGCRPKARVSMNIFQQKIQRGRIPAFGGDDNRLRISDRTNWNRSCHLPVIRGIHSLRDAVGERATRIVVHGLII